MNMAVKDNVTKFNDDVRRTGSYAYTGARLSSRLANGRISVAIANIAPFQGLNVLDVGCGDGAYSVELAQLGAAHVLGLDPAEEAVVAARGRAEALGLSAACTFEVGNVYTLSAEMSFDCAVLRGVLHHLPDPAEAIACVARLSDMAVLLEPNGTNPILKIIEKSSAYHRAHQEQSFLPATLVDWCRRAGFTSVQVKYINLVPMFCPDLLARMCRVLEPLAEATPFLRQLCCGQALILARK